MASGIAQAEKSLGRLEVSSAATSKELAQAAKITASVRTPAEKYAEKVEKLDKFMSKGLITQEVYGRAVAKAADEMEAAEGKTAKAAESVDRLASSVGSAAEKTGGVDALADKLMDAAGSAVKWTASMGVAYGQWQLWAAVKDPKAFSEFAMKGLKVVATARNAATALKLFGIGVAVAGGTTGVLSTAVLGLTNPMLGLTMAAINLTRQFFASREAAYETAKAVSALRLEAATTGETFQNLSLQKALDAGVAREDLIAMGLAISALDVKHFDDLAGAMSKSEAAAKRLETAEAGVTRTIGSAFTGLLEGLSSGFAGLYNGLADLTAGANALLTPIAQVFRPVGTLIGTIISGALRTVGVLGSLAGAVLRVGGLVASVFLSPFIVGLSNTANMLKDGLGSAFDWVSKKIASFNALLDTAYNYLSKMPVVGSVFASNEGGVVKAAAGGGGDAGGGAGGGNAAAEEADDFTAAIRRQNEAISSAIEKSQAYGEAGFAAAVQYQEAVRGLQADLERGILNETSFGQAADAARKAFEEQVGAMEARAAAAKKLSDEDADNEQGNAQAVTKQVDAFFKATEAAERFGAAGAAATAEYEGGLTSLTEKLNDGRINAESFADASEKLNAKFKKQLDGIKAVGDAERKRADEVGKLEEKIAEAGGFQADARAALGGKSNDALEVADIRSAEGMKTFMSLAAGREDPAIAEYRKSHETLQKMLGELRALQAAPLEIAGGAGG
jgi:hypothetical protein